MQNKETEAYGSSVPWIEVVAKGEFGAIPSPLYWRESAPLAYLINGYEELGRDELGFFANRQLRVATESGVWKGGIKDLWCCLFYEHRRARWTAPLVFELVQNPDGSVPDEQKARERRDKLVADADNRDEGSPLLHALCETLRRKLVNSELNERAGIVAWLAHHAALQSKENTDRE